jgi:hypothetical protein
MEESVERSGVLRLLAFSQSGKQKLIHSKQELISRALVSCSITIYSIGCCAAKIEIWLGVEPMVQ